MASDQAAAPERRVLHVGLEGSTQRTTIAWYLPGTSTADLRDAIAHRLGLAGADILVEDEATQSALALSPGLPSGIALIARPSPFPAKHSAHATAAAAAAAAAASAAASAGACAGVSGSCRHSAAAGAADGLQPSCATLSMGLAEPLLDAEPPHPHHSRTGIAMTDGVARLAGRDSAGGVADAELPMPLELPAGARAYVRMSEERLGLEAADGSGLRRPGSERAMEMASQVDAMLKLNRLASFLANERTFLAWIRTACSLFSLSISMIALSSQEEDSWRWLAIGTGFVVAVLAAVSYGHGVERYFRIKKVLLMRDPPAWYGRRSIQPFAALTAAVWAAVVVSYVLRGVFLQQAAHAA